MRLLPVFFVVSDLRGGACRGHSSFGKKRVSFSLTLKTNIIWNAILFIFSCFRNLFVYCCFTCCWFAKKRNFVARTQISLLSPTLDSIHICTDLL